MRHRTILPVIAILLFALVPMQASAEAPELFLDGVADHRVVDIGVTVSVTFSAGAEVFKYNDAACSTGRENRGTLEFTQSSAFAGTSWYQANTIGSPEEKSACLSITWQDPAGPSITVNGGTSFVEVESGESVTIDTDPGATIYKYNDSACTVGGYTPLSPAPYVESNTGPATFYYMASWDDTTRTGRSDCIEVRWNAPPPRTPPTLWLNDGTTDVTVQSFTDVEVRTETGAVILHYPTNTCAVVPFVIESTSFDFGSGIEGPWTQSFQAAWADDHSVRGDCLQVDWLRAGPHLYLNGSATHRTEEVGNAIHFTTEAGAQVVTYATLDCTGPETGRFDLEMTDTHTTPAAYSASAFWSGESTGARSCYVATWKEPPAPILLTLNGVAGDVEVSVGEPVKYESEPGATILTFPNERCNPPERSSEPGPVIDTRTSPGVVSVIALSGGLYSPCYTAIWSGTSIPDDGTATSTVEPSPPGTTTPEATSTSTAEAVQKQTTVRIVMWDGGSIEGASWSLYAPVASQFHSAPYLTGVLDTNNRTVFIDLASGQYRFVLEPSGMSALEFHITVSDASEEIVLHVQAPASDGAQVTGLPSTGSGTGAGSMMMWIASVVGAGIALSAIGGRRLKA